ncbi:MAG: hypothetical protein NQ127_01945 [Candidatus Cardinium sp.]|nr:hypothetical protein [Candidatus Cardinium sp.]
MKNLNMNIRKLLFDLVKFILRLLFDACAMVCIAKKAGKKLSSLIETSKDNMKIKGKKIGRMLLLICFIWTLLSLGLRFLLFGLATWLNKLLSGTCIGFCIVSVLCFLSALGMIRLLYKSNT